MTVRTSSGLAKRWNDLLPEQCNGISHHLLGHPANFMVRAEDVVRDALLAFCKLVHDRLLAANESEAALQDVLGFLGCQTRGHAARRLGPTRASMLDERRLRTDN